MAGLAPLLLLRLSLSTCCVLLLLLLAACPSLANGPCQQSSPIKRFDDFKDKHLPQGAPNTLDQNAWQKFINANKRYCNRPTQSFLRGRTALSQVKAVCSSQGGKVYNKDKDNLCISKTPFTFVKVKSEKGTCPVPGTCACKIKSVKEETKYLILACNKVANQCLPVHFEANPNNNKPDNNARACQAPAPKLYNADTPIWFSLHRFNRNR